MRLGSREEFMLLSDQRIKKDKQMVNIIIRDDNYLKPKKNMPPDKMILRKRDCLFSEEVYVVD